MGLEHRRNVKVQRKMIINPGKSYKAAILAKVDSKILVAQRMHLMTNQMIMIEW